MLQAVPHGDAIEFPGTRECSKFCVHFQPESPRWFWIHFRARSDPALFPRGEQKSSFAASHVEQSSPGSPFRFLANKAETLLGPEGGGESVPSTVVIAIVRCQILRQGIGDTNSTLRAPQNAEVLTRDVVVYTSEIRLQCPAAKKAGLLNGVGLRHGVLSAYTRQSSGRHSFRWQHCERLTQRIRFGISTAFSRSQSSQPRQDSWVLLRKQKARPGLAERAKQIVRRLELTLGFDGRFDLALLFLFLLLELITDEFQNGHFRPIADASATVDNARVTARAVCKLRRDFAE